MTTSESPLGRLYPHLAQEKAGTPERLDEALLEALQRKCRESVEVKQRFFDSQGVDVLHAAHVLADSYRNGGKLYSFGNGGSSCDAAHIAVEFQHPVTAGRPALAAQNLAQDMAMITAVGNDVGIAEIYARQMPGLIRAGDVALGISTSGNSPNVLKGLEVARSLGARTIGLSGGNGGEMARAVYLELCLVVHSDSIHRVQETHVAIYHVLWDLVHSLLADDRPAKGMR